MKIMADQGESHLGSQGTVILELKNNGSFKAKIISNVLVEMIFNPTRSIIEFYYENTENDEEFCIVIRQDDENKYFECFIKIKPKDYISDLEKAGFEVMMKKFD